MLEKIDPKYFEIPTWRNEKGFVRYKKLEDDADSDKFLVRDIDLYYSTEECEKILKEIPYVAIFQLDEKTYGAGLYLAERLRKAGKFCEDSDIYDFLTKDGVVIGRMDINFPIKHPPNYYIRGEIKPLDGVLLPRDLVGQDWRPSLDALIGRYCERNPEAEQYIPKETLQKFPRLQERKVKSSTQTSKNSSSGLGKV